MEIVDHYFSNYSILLRIKVSPEANELMAAAEIASDIYKKLQRDPSKFAELANKHSQSPNAEIGGDLGFQPAKSLAPEYYEAIKGKSIGHITKPIRTQYGLHIIRVMDKRSYEDIDKNIYQKIVYDSKRDEIIKKYFDELRAKATIKIEKKYLK